MENLKFKGKAKCFDCEEDALTAVLKNEIVAGDAVIIRYEGPKGGPGMREMLSTCLLYTSPSPRDRLLSRMPSSA